jgi:hypothetical protein
VDGEGGKLLYIKILSQVSMNATSFGNRIFADILKLR